MSSPHINAFYRIWFTWVDPLSLVLSVAACFLTPAAALEMLVPPSKMPYVPEQAAVIYQIGLLYSFLGIMFAVLLRASPDIKVWRIVEGATLFVDLALIVLSFVSLEQQNRLAFEEWRNPEVFNLFFTVLVALIRAAYLVGVGGSDEKVIKLKE